MELLRIKSELKKHNIRNKKTKYGLYIYTLYTTFFIDNFDLQLKRNDSKKNNDFIIQNAINCNEPIPLF